MFIWEQRKPIHFNWLVYFQSKVISPSVSLGQTIALFYSSPKNIKSKFTQVPEKPAGDELLPSVTYFVRLLHLLAKELGKDIRRYYCEVKRTVFNYSRMVF